MWNFKICPVATVIKTVWYCWRNKFLDHCNRIESPATEPQRSMPTDLQKCKSNSVEEKQPFQQMVLEHLDMHKQNNNK